MARSNSPWSTLRMASELPAAVSTAKPLAAERRAQALAARAVGIDQQQPVSSLRLRVAVQPECGHVLRISASIGNRECQTERAGPDVRKLGIPIS